MPASTPAADQAALRATTVRRGLLTSIQRARLASGVSASSHRPSRASRASSCR
jgi:hypothetical protein